MSFPCLIVHAGNDHRQQYCCQLLASSASSPSPPPLLLFFFFFPFLSFPTQLSPCSGHPGLSSRVELGPGSLPAPIWATNQAEVSTHTQIHSNCRPFPCPHVTACRSEALPHAATHKLGTVSSLQFIWWIVRYSYKDQLGLVFAFGSWGFVVFHDFRGCL